MWANSRARESAIVGNSARRGSEGKEKKKKERRRNKKQIQQPQHLRNNVGQASWRWRSGLGLMLSVSPGTLSEDASRLSCIDMQGTSESTSIN